MINPTLKIIFAFFLLLQSNSSNGQLELDWVTTLGAASSGAEGNSITTDVYGNVYTLGFFSGTLDFDPKIGVTNLTSSGSGNAFIQKLDRSGNLVWVKRMGGNYTTAAGVGNTIKVDSLGYVYTLGYFDGYINYSPINGIPILVSNGIWDIFIQKLDPQGNILWAKSFGGAQEDYGSAISIDGSGNIYTTGFFKGNVDFDPNVGSNILSSSGGKDIFIQKLNSEGNLVWAKKIGGFQDDSGQGMTIDHNGNVLITGEYYNTVDFDPNVNNFNLTSTGYSDIFIQKLDSSGNFIWAKSIGGVFGEEYGSAIEIDNIGNIYTTGIFRGTADLNPGIGIDSFISNGYEDFFLLKLDPNGNFLWVKRTGGIFQDLAHAIAIDNSGNIYTVGEFQKTVDFNPNAGISNLTASTGLDLDIFIQKLDPNGNFVWVTSIGSTSNAMGYSVAISNSADVYSTGRFEGTADFDPSTSIHNITSFGNIDAFILKLSQNRVSGHIFNDFNQNCSQEANESGIVKHNLLINPGNIITTSTFNGHWGVKNLPPGTYSATVDTSGYWVATCPSTQFFTVAHSDSFSIAPTFGLFSTNPCGIPDISVHAPFLRPGFSNQKVYVKVCNQKISSGIIDSIYVLVELPPLLIVQSASLPFTSLGNNQYYFFVDTLYPDFCADFWLNCHLDSSAIIGQTLCINARLFPIDSCSLNIFPNNINPCNTAYDGSQLAIRTACNNDTISFVITNTSDYDMTCFSQVRLYIDGQFIWVDSVQLTSGDTSMYVFLGDGRTWRMEVDQYSLPLGISQPSATIELCGDTTNWTPNLVNIFPHDDADPNIDIFCGIVRGSYDPNDKSANPLGVGYTHDILPNQELEYLIRFQNTGTDTAFTIVIKDTLSTELDIFSVRSGVSSHNYSFRMYDSRILEWTFNNIMLPDSNINESASHGFVKFKVNPNKNIPNGSIIQNSAAIYFDFNSPILTNTTWHTIHENIFTINTVKIQKEELNLKVYPNPTEDNIYIEKQITSEIDILIIDNLGRVLLSKKSTELITEIDLKKLTSGIYFLTINNNKQSTTQKIVKQ